MTVDTVLTGWGTRTAVKAPPAGQVIDIRDLEDVELPEDKPFIPASG